MSDTNTFVAEPRSRAGKGASRAVRRLGHVPGVIYGGKQPPELVSLPLPPIIKAHLTGKMMSRVYYVDIGGKKTRVVPRDVQVDPVRDRPIHVDLLRLPPGARVSIFVPVEFKNHEASPGIKRGGVLNIVRHEVELIVNADAIPDHLEVDLTGLEINDSIHISAIKLPEGAKPKISNRDFTIATVAPSSGFASDAAEAAAAAAAAAGAPVVEAGAEGAAAPAAGDAKAPEAKEKGKK